MAADARISRGLELFAAGDLKGAATEWLLAKRELGTSPQLDTYLSFVDKAAPQAFAEAELALADQPAPNPDAAPVDAASVSVSPSPPSRVPVSWMLPPPPAPPVFEPLAAPGITTAMSMPPAEPHSGVRTMPMVPIPVPVPQSVSPRLISEPPFLGLPALLPEHSGTASAFLPSPPVESQKSALVLPALALPPIAAAVAPLALALEPLPDLLSPAVPVATPPTEPWGDATVLGPPLLVDSLASALQLVAQQRKPSESAAVSQSEWANEETKLRELMGLDDFSGALRLADTLLATDPKHALALSARAHCRERLEQMYLSRIGALIDVPRVLIPPEQVIWLDLDHRSGFLLAQVDSVSSYEDLVELSGMDRLEALRLLAQLVQKSVIGSQG